MLNIEFLANLSQFFFIHSRHIDSCVLFNRINHGDASVRSFKINCVFANCCFGCSKHLHGYILQHLLGKFHHPIVVCVGYIYLHHSKLWIVCAVHSFISEVARKLVHTIKTTHNQTLQVQLIGNAQIEWHVQCIVMRGKWTSSCTTWYALQNRSVHLEVTSFIEKGTHGVKHFSAFHKSFSHVLVHNQVNIALTVTHFRVGKTIVRNTIFCFNNGKGLQRFC